MMNSTTIGKIRDSFECDSIIDQVSNLDTRFLRAILRGLGRKMTKKKKHYINWIR